MLEYNLDDIKLKIVTLDASEDDYIGFDWFRDDKYFNEIWAKYIFKFFYCHHGPTKILLSQNIALGKMFFFSLWNGV